MVAGLGGVQVRVNSWVQGCCQGHPQGRCRTILRAEVAIRLKAMTAQTSQAALAQKTPEGICASALSPRTFVWPNPAPCLA